MAEQIKTCSWCREVLLAGEENHIVSDMHHECAVRMAAGSVAHLEKRCGCFVPDSDEGDPPGISRREAAKLAYKVYNATVMLPTPARAN